MYAVDAVSLHSREMDRVVAGAAAGGGGGVGCTCWFPDSSAAGILVRHHLDMQPSTTGLQCSGC